MINLPVLQNKSDTTAVRKMATEIDGSLNTLDKKVIYDSGSNSGGNYIRFADGTLQCWINTVINGININNGPTDGFYNSSPNGWNLPVPFIDKNYVLTTTARSLGHRPFSISLMEIFTPTIASYSFLCINTLSGIDVYIGLFAIGRWK